LPLRVLRDYLWATSDMSSAVLSSVCQRKGV
ncbi:unnamed protein product, partial [marine sediment metagenome]